jgi:hypothetical protein
MARIVQLVEMDHRNEVTSSILANLAATGEYLCPKDSQLKQLIYFVKTS